MNIAGLEEEGQPRQPRDVTKSTVECVQKLSGSLRRSARFGALPADDPLALELRRCITAYVKAIRSNGTPPEAAVVMTKKMMADHLRVDDHTCRAITDDVVRWAIAAYF